MTMNIHLVSKETNKVVYSDKTEEGTLSEIQGKYGDFIVVVSQTGQPNAPVIFPGYLYYEGCFWAPQRAFDQRTEAQSVPLSRQDFFRLFTFEEFAKLYDFRSDAELSQNEVRTVNAFLKYVEGLQLVLLTDPTIIQCLNFLESIGYITKERLSEIFLVTVKQ